jgi:hypothetical protein
LTRQSARIDRAPVERLLELGMTSTLAWILTDNPGRRFYEALRGSAVRERKLTIGGRDVKTIGYGWPDVHALVNAERARRHRDASA